MTDMTDVLADYARRMRGLMLGPTPPESLDALKATAESESPAPQRKVLNATAAMRRYFGELAEAVFSGRKYSDVAPAEFVSKMKGTTKEKWDAACLFEPEKTDAPAKPAAKAGKAQSRKRT